MASKDANPSRIQIYQTGGLPHLRLVVRGWMTAENLQQQLESADLLTELKARGCAGITFETYQQTNFTAVHGKILCTMGAKTFVCAGIERVALIVSDRVFQTKLRLLLEQAIFCDAPLIRIFSEREYQSGLSPISWL